MNIFDYINNILFHKKELDIETDGESQFSGYLTNRWISMYSPEMAIIINNSTNWLYSVFETKQEYYKFLLTIIPKVQQRYIRYIKKVKDESIEDSDDNTVTILAKNLELSKREIKLYLELNN